MLLQMQLLLSTSFPHSSLHQLAAAAVVVGRVVQQPSCLTWRAWGGSHCVPGLGCVWWLSCVSAKDATRWLRQA
jgi:hypothetical protein